MVKSCLTSNRMTRERGGLKPNSLWNVGGKEVKPMRNDDAKVITIQKTVKESNTNTRTETVKIEVKPVKARKMAKTKENTTTPETVVVFHSRG